MQYVFFIIFLCILVHDVRKGVLIYAPFKLFFLSGIKLLGSFSFDAVISIVAVSIYIIKYHEHLKIKKIPWTQAIIAGIVFSIINGLFPELTGGVICSSFTVMCVNGVIEYVIGTNFLREIQQSIATEGTYFSENTIERFGITHRVCSCIPHSIGYGTVCACFLFLIIYIIYYTNIHLNLFITIVSLFLLFSGIVLSASRSPLLGLAIMLLPFALSKKMFEIKNIIFFSLLMIIAYYYAGEFIVKMFLSMVNENEAMEASGSGIEMRQTQYELTMMVWSQNPIFGHGHVELEQIDRSGMLRGAESLWFQLLIRRGIVGFIGYILFYCFIIRDIIKTQNERMFKLAFWTGWIIINSVTSLPGITDFLALMILSLMYKFEYLGYIKRKTKKIYNIQNQHICLKQSQFEK